VRSRRFQFQALSTAPSRAFAASDEIASRLFAYSRFASRLFACRMPRRNWRDVSRGVEVVAPVAGALRHEDRWP
jgi:hypothetical protein